MRVHLRRAVFTFLAVAVLIFLCVVVIQNNDVATIESSSQRNGHSPGVRPVHVRHPVRHPVRQIPVRYQRRRRHPRPVLDGYTSINRRPDKFGPVVASIGSYPKLWPHDGHWLIGADFDRIAAQMKFVPRGYTPAAVPKDKYKTIALYEGDDNMPMGREKFLRDKCPVNTCVVTNTDFRRADALLFKTSVYTTVKDRPPNQTWILFALESPLNTGLFEIGRNQVNWTATYRPDSTIVAPYEKFQFFANVSELPKTAPRDYAAGKKKLVAWFVSNCDTTNKRMEYVQELQQYMEVDIFGGCGRLTCPREEAQSCFDMLTKDYKFYLAFENSNCQYYITEKFFRNALMNDIVPVVMGARREDYAIAAPPHSYIHVEDFRSPKKLARYLRTLDANDHLYNEYFRWKGTGEFIDTKFWCRLCAMLHTDHVQWYPDVNNWWHHNGTCTSGSWGDPSRYIPPVLV